MYKIAVFLGLIALASAGNIQLSLIQKVQSHGSHDAVIVLPQVIDQVLATPSLKALSGDAKTDHMVSIMEKMTQETQAPFMVLLKKLKIADRATQFWISNKISVTGMTPEVIEALQEFPGEFTVREPIIASLFPAINSTITEVEPDQGNPQWGVAAIKAPEAWARANGRNVVVANIDTGVNRNHVALRDNFAGAWLDPYYNNAQPSDTHGHGSHAMGSIVGTANGIGVAPGATWIACRGLNNQGSGTDAGLTTCAQFMLTANPRPKVVSNSWGGGSGDTWFNTEITAWRNAGIIPVFALGNSGPSCRTANSPGDQPNLISVGATANGDTMASFSSRGPSTRGVQKPEVSAPGANIISAGTGASNYATMSGTSMACPHVAGAVAIILSNNPSATFAQVLSALETTADHPQVSNADRQCGTGDWPNMAFGHGRINVAKAIGL